MNFIKKNKKLLLLILLLLIQVILFINILNFDNLIIYQPESYFNNLLDSNTNITNKPNNTNYLKKTVIILGCIIIVGLTIYYKDTLYNIIFSNDINLISFEALENIILNAAKEINNSVLSMINISEATRGQFNCELNFLQMMLNSNIENKTIMIGKFLYYSLLESQIDGEVTDLIVNANIINVEWSPVIKLLLIANPSLHYLLQF